MARAHDRDDGIYYGWYVTLACFLGTFVVYGLSYSFGVFFDVILTDFGGSRGGTALVFSVHTFVLYVGAFAVGGVVDAYGARRPLLAGGVLLGVGLYWTSHAGTIVELFLAYGILVALGLGVVFVVSYATVPRWFGRRRGWAGGIASAGLGVGMVLVAPAAAVGIERYGWQRTYLLLSVLVLAALGVAVLLVADDPDSAGVDTGDEFEGDAFAAGTRSDPTLSDGRFRDALAVGMDRSFLLVFAGWIGIYATLYVVLVHLPAYVVDAGMARGTGALALGAIGATSVVGRIGIGYLGDRAGRVRTFVACSALMGLATLALPAVGSRWAVGLFALVFGLGYGGNGALLAPLVADLFGTTNLNTTFGLASTSFAVSGLLAPWLAGSGYDVLGTYLPAFLASGVAALLGAGLVAMAGRGNGTAASDPAG